MQRKRAVDTTHVICFYAGMTEKDVSVRFPNASAPVKVRGLSEDMLDEIAQIQTDNNITSRNNLILWLIRHGINHYYATGEVVPVSQTRRQRTTPEDLSPRNAEKKKGK